MRIAIDPGHVKGSGASGNGLEEHEVALMFANKLATELQSRGHEVKIFDHPTGYSNNQEFVQVVKEANDWGAQLYISLHCDCSSNTSARGAHVCFRSRKGLKLSKSIAQQLCPLMQGRAEQVKQRLDLYVLRATKAVAALIELGFLSNKEDSEKLITQMDKLVQAIANGIDSYANS